MSGWLSVLDYLPIVGTVKSGVEAVVALCEGEFQEAGEKAAQTVVGAALDLMTGGVAHAAGSVASAVAAKQVAKKLAVQAGTVAVATAISANVRVKVKPASIRVVDQTPRTDQVTRKRKRSSRGEHVINNNVLKLFKKIIDEFVDCHMNTCFEELIFSGRVTPTMGVYRDYYQPLPPDQTRAIQIEMVAHIPDDELYIDANAAIYGWSAASIQMSVVSCMQTLFEAQTMHIPASHLTARESALKALIYTMNANQVYVDQDAKRYWLLQGGSLYKFQKAKEATATMLERLIYTGDEDMVLSWVDDLVAAGGATCPRAEQRLATS
ncbi:uncharacterized protein [Ambystoma mexicanum]|uniref:uncharacterized protein n=1 Tax=Ambystoma mexicanum TaxID=8296 RepID=UPI0037E7F31D